MQQYFKTLAKNVLFWLLFFFTARSLFLIVHHSLLVGIGFWEIVSLPYHALRLDIATICYLSSLPLLLFSAQLFFRHKILSVCIRVVVVVELLFASIIYLAETGIYSEWLCKLDYKALLYLRHPMEILSTASNAQVIFSVFAIVSLTVGFYILYVKFVVRPEILPWRKHYFLSVLVSLIMPVLCFGGMRGGINAIPISKSAACFSHHEILNNAAINPLWHIVWQTLDFGSLNDKNTFCFMESEEAQAIMEEFNRCEKDTLVSVLKTKNINIVIILLESWTADVIQSLTGTEGVTPCFHALEKEGLLFTRFYSNGHRSQQAISSLLSSFPPVPQYDITDNQGKYRNLPALPLVLQQHQYNSSFYFGGNLDYGNIRAFLYHANFDKMVEEKNLRHASPRGKLGIQDEYMFVYHAEELNKMKTPFFSMLFTVSSHSPFDHPKITAPLRWDSKELNYLNSAKYTDHCLGEYFEKVKKLPCYDNTLFIVVADHSHPSHLGRNYYSKEFMHIPMLWLGKVLKDEYVGKQCAVVGSHIDIVPTLLNQLGFDKEAFTTWGKDIFNPYCPHFAYFEVKNGFGIITDSSSVIHYSLDGDDKETRTYFIGEEREKETLLKKGKAFSQYLFETYKAY